MTSDRETATSREAFIEELARTQTQAEREELLAKNESSLATEIVSELAKKVVERVRVDTHHARALAESALLIAEKLGGKEEIALGLRAKANALYASGDSKEAVHHHDQAFQIYSQVGNQKEAARTLSSSIQPLILMGEYDRAFQASERAREIFTKLEDPWRIARLEINVGNIFHRQDRFEEALAHYERAYAGMIQHRDIEGIAVVLSNMAVCLISLNDFSRALSSYQQARNVCEKAGMPLLVAQADYNVAYLYYLRGEYGSAIERLYAARRACEATGDAYHFALCHLDLSDVYLELNLSEEARNIAHEGYLRFEAQGMRYEAAKTLANEATAYGQQGKTVQALELFAKAREMFAQESNLVWPRLLDLYQALLLFHEGRHFESRRLCVSAAAFFDEARLRSKSVIAHLLLARIALQLGDVAEAEKRANTAVERLSSVQTPVLEYQVHFLLGQLAHKKGELATARDYYQSARQALESMRTRIHTEELKISFGQNRLQVYEALVDIFMAGAAGEQSKPEAFACIEAAKSRSMSEMIFRSGQSLPMGETGQSNLVRRIRDLREDLNWYYHRIELEQLGAESNSESRIALLHQQAQEHEKELMRTLRELPAQERENATLEAPTDFSLEYLKASLPPHAALVEYYSTGDRLIAAVVSPTKMEIVSVSVISRIQNFLQLLRFQLSKFRMGSAYTQRFVEPMQRAAESHLELLYNELIAPIRPLLDNYKHLVFVPHGPLHFLPFHALRHSGKYLCDDFSISYAPSATIFALCQQKQPNANSRPLVFGIADQNAPEIDAEVKAVANMLHGSELLLGEQATAEALRERGPSIGLLHVATHGTYRQDNPMFSGIRLGDGYLYLYDLYQMRIPARLVTLSGCATGMNVVAEGDELLGLQRGLFCAGASTLLLSLWDVHDETTAELMSSFYSHFTQSDDMAGSLRLAMQEIRESHPHPYYWAPFLLTGQLIENKPVN
ncbi:MAG TPA: CHAT domain-containing protein [Candidatus Dormibacteraeota bacterium]|jgi:CHAT domain-containing protein|nr:CHAT domain-containing protein [Candidatus Dormibacteraeota bacterium]